MLLLLVCWYDLQAGHLDLVNDVSRNRSTKSFNDRLTSIVKSSICFLSLVSDCQGSQVLLPPVGHKPSQARDVPECDGVELVAASGARCGANRYQLPTARSTAQASCIIEPGYNPTPTLLTCPYLFYKDLVKTDHKSLLDIEFPTYPTSIYTRSLGQFPIMASRKKVLLKVQSPHLLRVTSTECFRKGSFC